MAKRVLVQDALGILYECQWVRDIQWRCGLCNRGLVSEEIGEHCKHCLSVVYEMWEEAGGFMVVSRKGAPTSEIRMEDLHGRELGRIVNVKP